MLLNANFQLKIMGFVSQDLAKFAKFWRARFRLYLAPLQTQGADFRQVSIMSFKPFSKMKIPEKWKETNKFKRAEWGTTLADLSLDLVRPAPLKSTMDVFSGLRDDLRLFYLRSNFVPALFCPCSNSVLTTC